MLSSAKRFLLVSILVLLAGCGFQPMYGGAGDDSIEVGTYLASIDVKTQGPEELGHKLRINMEDRFNPKSEASLYGKAFLLETRITAPRTPLGIGQSGEIARYDIALRSDYVLSDAETGEVLDKGRITRRVSYFNLDEKFATYAAEQDAINRGLRELAEDYKIRMAAFFAEQYKLTRVAY